MEALSKEEMVVGPQGTTCLVSLDFNVGHVFVWLSSFSGSVYYGLAPINSRLMHFEVFVHGHWGHIQGSARRYLLLNPWRVGRLQMAHSNLSKANAPLSPRCARFLFLS